MSEAKVIAFSAAVLFAVLFFCSLYVLNLPEPRVPCRYEVLTLILEDEANGRVLKDTGESYPIRVTMNSYMTYWWSEDGKLGGNFHASPKTFPFVYSLVTECRNE